MANPSTRHRHAFSRMFSQISADEANATVYLIRLYVTQKRDPNPETSDEIARMVAGLRQYVTDYEAPLPYVPVPAIRH